ncbi:MAG: RNA ligase family protein [Candidatus Altimarinota bacterium]
MRKLLGLPLTAPVWKHLNGSKNVILEKSDARASWYGTDEFRYNVTKNLELRKGEVIYFEIVGWVNDSTSIMPPHGVDKKTLPEVEKQYGNTIHYTYGCPVGEHRLYVYKIMQVNEDGHGVDLSWPQVKQRCKELGLAHVPELAGPLTPDLLKWREDVLHVEDGTEKKLWQQSFQQLLERYVSGPSTLNAQQIREGVVVRVESALGTMYLKEKSFDFKVLEGIIASDDEFIDPENLA